MATHNPDGGHPVLILGTNPLDRCGDRLTNSTVSIGIKVKAVCDAGFGDGTGVQKVHAALLGKCRVSIGQLA